MPRESAQFLARTHGSQPNRFVCPAPGEDLAVPGESDGPNRTRDSPETVQEFPPYCVPQHDRSVFASRSQEPAVGRQFDRFSALLMPFELPQFSASGHIPGPDRLVETGRGQGLAVLREGDGADVLLMPFQLM